MNRSFTQLLSFRSVALLAAGLICTGCGDTVVVTPGKPTIEPTAASEQPATKPEEKSAAEPPAAELTPEQVKLTAVDWDTMQKTVAEHSGKVVVLDVWSTSCQPCIREFHHLVELSESHPDEVVCLSFSLDYAGIKSKPPAFYEERVRKFLSEQGAKFDNYLCSEDPEGVYEALNLASIPAVMVFGKDGKLVERFDNDQGKYGEEFTYKDHILPRVESLLAADSATTSGN